MSTSYVPYSPDQEFLLPPSLQDWLPKGHLAYFISDTVDALGDGLEPANSGDESIPRFTWGTHRGTTEWVQYDFSQTKEVSSVEVYWFDDTGKRDCRVPKRCRYCPAKRLVQTFPRMLF